MSRETARKLHYYAVVRFEADATSPEDGYTIKEVVPTKDEADREVARLSEINRGKNCRYWVQLARVFPDGLGGGDSE